MDTRVKFGIIGAGNMGAIHLGFFSDGRIENAIVTAVADIDGNKLRQIRALRPGDYACFSSGAELIEKADVDAVIIATPHFSHPELAKAAFQKGLHVLSEKPTGVYGKQIVEMNEAAAKSGKLFGVMFNQRANPLHMALHDQMQSGAIGRLKRVNWIITNWYRTQHYYDSGAWRATWAGEGGGVLINQAIHQIDLLQWFVGMPRRVRAFCGFGRWHDVEVEDDVTAYLDYGDGASGVFVTSTGEPHGVNRLEIVGTTGKLHLENGVLTRTLFDVDERAFCNTCETGFGQPNAQTEELLRMTDGFDRHVDVLNRFVAAIRGLEPLFVDGREGIQSIRLINAMLLSSWENREIEMPLDDDAYFAALRKRIATSRKKEAAAGIIEENSCSFGGF